MQCMPEICTMETYHSSSVKGKISDLAVTAVILHSRKVKHGPSMSNSLLLLQL